MLTDQDKRPINETLNDIAEQIDGRVTDDYSGRGMYGKTCYGITCDNATECIELAAIAGIRGAKTDNMGRRVIVYWPSIVTTKADEPDTDD